MTGLTKTILCVALFALWGIVCIVPIYAYDMSYAASMAFLFWLPVAAMLWRNWNWLAQRRMLRPFFLANIIMDIFAFFFEYACIGMKVWSFSQTHHRLLPVPIIDVPVEEFMFWFGATPFCILLYVSFYRILHYPAEKKETRVILSIWAFLAFIFLPAARFIHREIDKQYGGRKILSWPALMLTTAAFWFVMFFVEHHSIVCGHWVFNRQRIWELYVWKVPIEEFIFYTLGPIFVVLLMHFVELGPRFEYKKTDIIRGG